MNSSNCECKINCTYSALVASGVIGILTSVFRYNAIITITSAFLWVLFGIAVGFLGIALLNSASCCGDRNVCCCSIRQFLSGILGTALTSVILLGINFVATSIIGAIISGLLLFFFSLVLTSATCVIKCRYNCD